MILRACFLLFSATLANGYFLNLEECLNYTVYPVQYELSITPNILDSKHGYYDCDLDITILAHSPAVQVMELDASNGLLIQGNIQVIDQSTKIDIINAYRPYVYDESRGKLKIFLITPLKQYNQYHTLYNVKISFRSNFNTDSDGIFLTETNNVDHVNRNVLVTRLSPNKGKYFFPCFDNLQFESHFKFKVKLVERGSQYKTTLTVADQQKKYTENNKKTTIIEYAPSEQISLHQVGFHASDYESIRAVCKYNETLIIWAPRTTLQYYKFILNFGRNITNIIHDSTGLKRAIVKGTINIISVPKHLDGFEIDSWNLLTNSEYRLSYDTKFISIKQKEKMMFDLVQQLTRIWLGNPEEPQERTRWKEQWFKEGVATYLANYFLAEYHGWPMDVYMLHMKHRAMNLDWLHTTPSLSTFDTTLAVEIPPRYKDLISWKTASILWMIEKWVGSGKFHRALINYINSRRGKHITLQEFTTQLDLDTVECREQMLNGKTPTVILNSWFHQPGYPLVEVTTFRNRTPNVVLLKQSRFTFSKKVQGSEYKIPISYILQRYENCYSCDSPPLIVEADSYSFEENLDSGWILLNRNASGYYRVNYDIETWSLIAKALLANVESIDAINRAQIVNDVFAIYTSGGMSYELATEILRFLTIEHNPIVWQSAAEGFQLLKTEGAHCNMTHINFDEWKAFMRNCIDQVYYSIIETNDQQSRLFRSIIRDFACYLEHQNCLFRLNAIYSGYLRGTNVLHPDVRAACYYNAFTSGATLRQTNNLFEEEDKIAAELKWQTHRRFWHYTPQGYKTPLPLLSTTPQPETTTEVILVAKVGPNSGNNIFASMRTVFLIIFISYINL